MIKSTEELDLIELSARWGHRAHELLQQYARPGIGEVELSMQASFDATKEMLDGAGTRATCRRAGRKPERTPVFTGRWASSRRCPTC